MNPNAPSEVKAKGPTELADIPEVNPTSAQAKLAQNILQLHLIHDRLKANRRERKELLKQYEALKKLFPAFNEDPMLDSE